MKEDHNASSKTTRFIERHSDGTATLNYPGWPPQKYGSMKAAYNRIRAIKTGSARSVEELIKRPWTEQESEIVREHWGLILPHEWPDRLPGRSYYAIKSYARDHKIRAAEIRRARPVDEIRPKSIGGWTPDEIEILKTNSLPAAKNLLSSQRTAVAVEKMLRRVCPSRPDTRKSWTAEEILVLYGNTPKKAWEILSHSRTRKAVERMMIKMGIKTRMPSDRWSDSEIVLIKNIIRSSDALISRHNRTTKAIYNKIDKERKRHQFAAAATAAVKSACANLEPSVRQDVEGEILLLVLSKQIKTSQINEVIRSVRTRIYGRRHLSLDAPIGDGSTTWIENISSDQIHF